jgi:hypothetical protein
MLARDALLVKFVVDLTKVNKGRAFLASPDRLEEIVFMDFIRNRERRVRRGSGADGARSVIPFGSTLSDRLVIGLIPS